MRQQQSHRLSLLWCHRSLGPLVRRQSRGTGCLSIAVVVKIVAGLQDLREFPRLRLSVRPLHCLRKLQTETKEH